MLCYVDMARPLLLADPVDGHRSSISAEELAPACGWVNRIYSLLQADGNFRLLAGSEEPAMVTAIAAWLRARLSNGANRTSLDHGTNERIPQA